MNKLQLFVFPAVAALSLAAAFSAHATNQSFEGSDYDFASSRAAVTTPAKVDQVVTVNAAKVAVTKGNPGVANPLSYDYNPLALAQSTKSREEVRGEVLAQQAAQRGRAIANVDEGYIVVLTPAPKAAKTGYGQ